MMAATTQITSATKAISAQPQPKRVRVNQNKITNVSRLLRFRSEPTRPFF
jgi:hypothetical protein